MARNQINQCGAKETDRLRYTDRCTERHKNSQRLSVRYIVLQKEMGEIRELLRCYCSTCRSVTVLTLHQDRVSSDELPQGN